MGILQNVGGFASGFKKGVTGKKLREEKDKKKKRRKKKKEYNGNYN